MSSAALNDIVQITIDRQTQSVQKASFGVFAFISEFLTSKTTVAFDRSRFYVSLAEMVTDGWATTDRPYLAAAALFAQNPRPTQIMIGRKDAGDSTWTDALVAIAIAETNWYTFQIDSQLQANQVLAATWAETEKRIHYIDANDIAEIVWDADFITLNSIEITVTIAGVATVVGPVVFATDHDTTMDLVVAELIADGFQAELDPNDANNRTVLIVTTSPQAVVTEAVTLGASQATGTVTDFYIPSAGSVDIAAVLNAATRERTAVQYHGVFANFFSAAWNGVALPKDPGSQTWAFKTLSGITAVGLTSAARTQALGKEANIYEAVGGVNITEFGTVASGEYIDIIRGIDKLESLLQENVYALLISVDKVPFTDEGIALVENAVLAALNEMARDGLLVQSSLVVTVPEAADVSSTDKANRTLPDVEFTATLQGAIHKVQIAGIVSV